MIEWVEQPPIIYHGGAMIMIRLFMPPIIHVAIADMDATYGAYVAPAAENDTAKILRASRREARS